MRRSLIQPKLANKKNAKKSIFIHSRMQFPLAMFLRIVLKEWKIRNFSKTQKLRIFSQKQKVLLKQQNSHRISFHLWNFHWNVKNERTRKKKKKIKKLKKKHGFKHWTVKKLSTKKKTLLLPISRKLLWSNNYQLIRNSNVWDLAFQGDQVQSKQVVDYGKEKQSKFNKCSNFSEIFLLTKIGKTKIMDKIL